MKKYIFVFLMFLPLIANAQSSQEAIIKQINTAVSRISTMQCDFEQTKHMKMLNNKLVSTGIMKYQQSDKLRWEYKNPYNYIFILNGSKVYLKKGSRNDVIDIKQNKVFKSIAQIMMNSVVGKCLTDTKEFDVSIVNANNEWVATLIPQKKELKQMYAKIILHFNKSNSIIQTVEMCEKNGDKTIIELKNVQLNKSIDSSAFSN